MSLRQRRAHTEPVVSSNLSHAEAWTEWHCKMQLYCDQLMDVDVSGGNLRQRVTVLSKALPLLQDIERCLDWLDEQVELECAMPSSVRNLSLRGLQQPHSLLLICLRLMTDLQATSHRQRTAHSTELHQLLSNPAFNALCSVFNFTIYMTACVGTILTHDACPDDKQAVAWADPQTHDVVCRALEKDIVLCDKRMSIQIPAKSLTLCRLLEAHLEFVPAHSAKLIHQLLSSSYLSPLCSNAQTVVMSKLSATKRCERFPLEVPPFISVLLSVLNHTGPLTADRERQQQQLQHSTDLSSLVLTLARQLLKERGGLDGSGHCKAVWRGPKDILLTADTVAEVVVTLLDAVLLGKQAWAAGGSSSKQDSSKKSSSKRTAVRSPATTYEMAHLWVQLHKRYSLAYMWPPFPISESVVNTVKNVISMIPAHKQNDLAHDLVATALTTIDEALQRIAHCDTAPDLQEDFMLASIETLPNYLHASMLDECLLEGTEFGDKIRLGLVCCRAWQAVQEVLQSDAGPSVAAAHGATIAARAEATVRLLSAAEVLSQVFTAMYWSVYQLTDRQQPTDVGGGIANRQLHASFLLTARKKVLARAGTILGQAVNPAAAASTVTIAAHVASQNCNHSALSELAAGDSVSTAPHHHNRITPAGAEVAHGSTANAQQGPSPSVTGSMTQLANEQTTPEHGNSTQPANLDTSTEEFGIKLNVRLVRICQWLPACQLYLFFLMRPSTSQDAERLTPEMCALWLCITRSVSTLLQHLPAGQLELPTPSLLLSVAPWIAGQLVLSVTLQGNTQHASATIAFAQQSACEALLACLRLPTIKLDTPAESRANSMSHLLQLLDRGTPCFPVWFDQAVGGELRTRVRQWCIQTSLVDTARTSTGPDCSSTTAAPAQTAVQISLPGVPSHITLHPSLGCWRVGCTCLSGSSESSLPTHRCRGCKVARYCSLDCHNQDWAGGHGRECRQLLKERRMQRQRELEYLHQIQDT